MAGRFQYFFMHRKTLWKIQTKIKQGFAMWWLKLNICASQQIISQIRLEDIDILASTIKSDTHLLTLEALYIRELKPYLNTQNAKEQDFKSRQLRISF